MLSMMPDKRCELGLSRATGRHGNPREKGDKTASVLVICRCVTRPSKIWQLKRITILLLSLSVSVGQEFGKGLVRQIWPGVSHAIVVSCGRSWSNWGLARPSLISLSISP